MIKYINELKKEELDGKKILLRVDFDVPIMDSKITEDFRIKAQKETIDHLIGAGAKVLMVGHLGHEVSDASFYPIIEELGEILGQTLTLVPHSELDEVNKLFKASPVTHTNVRYGASPLLLLDNIRQDSREVQN